jgi:glycine betaine/choline ABC-type transport system substrate-binding protein
VSTISDWARLVQQNPQAATLRTAAEFPTRNDGLPGVEKTYGVDLPDANVAVLDFGLVYTSVAAEGHRAELEGRHRRRVPGRRGQGVPDAG